MADHHKNGVLLRSLLEKSFGFIALMTDTNKMDYDSSCALLKSEIERCKDRRENEVSAPVIAARFAEKVSRNGFKTEKN